MRYELIREIFNQCSNNQMRDVFVSEIETDDPDGVVLSYCKDPKEIEEKTLTSEGSLIYDVCTSGMRQRFSFTPDE